MVKTIQAMQAVDRIKTVRKERFQAALGSTAQEETNFGTEGSGKSCTPVGRPQQGAGAQVRKGVVWRPQGQKQEQGQDGQERWQWRCKHGGLIEAVASHQILGLPRRLSRAWSTIVSMGCSYVALYEHSG